MLKTRLTLVLVFLSLLLSSQEQKNLITSIKQCSDFKKQFHLQNHDTIGLNYDLHYHRINWFLNPGIRYIRGSVRSAFEAREPVDSVAFQLGDAMQVDSIVYHNSRIAYVHQEDVITAYLPSEIDEGTNDSLTIFYQGSPADSAAFAQGVHGPDDTPVIWTLSEPYGAKQWWPSKNALTDKIDSLDIFVHVTPTQYKAASNGILVKDTVMTSEDKRIFHWKHRYPITTYLVAVAVSDYRKFDEYIHFRDDSLRQVNYIYEEDYNFAVNHIPNYYKSFKLFDTLFMPYPFFEEQYGHAQMNRGGGMEHQTMTFIGSYDFHLLTHEVAHQWFGNYITLDNWHDIWLNEGFATYLTGLAYEKAFDTDKWWDIWRPQIIGHVTSEPGGSVYVPDVSDRERIFDARLSYSKGAYLLHMLRWVIGDEAFFQAIRNYLADPAVAHGYAGNEDLIYHLEEQGDTTLTEFFNDWYYGEGYPSYEVKTDWINEGHVTVTLSQQQSHPSVDFFEMPVPVEFKNSIHDTVVIFNHTHNNQQFETNLGFFPDSVFVDPNYHLISAENSTLLSTSSLKEDILLKLQPNPVTSFVQIISDQKMNSVRVYSADGRFVEEHGFDGSEKARINTRKLNAGVYLLRIEMEAGMIRSLKFVKQ